MIYGETSTKYHTSEVIVGNRAKDLVAFGYSQGWDFPVLGSAPIPNNPIHVNGWLIVPAHLDNTPLPKRAQKRMNAIFCAGIKPKGWFVIHEAPQQLPAPSIKNEPSIRRERLSPQTRAQTKKVLKAAGSVLGIAALATGMLPLAIAAITVVIPAFLIVGAILVCPILVAVTEDGFWVEIDRWDT